MKKTLAIIACFALALGLISIPKSFGGNTTTIDFKIISPNCWFTDQKGTLEIEYNLENYYSVATNPTLYIDIIRLNTVVWPLPDWVDKTYYLSKTRYEQLFDAEFNEMVSESEAMVVNLELPKTTGQKLRKTISLDPYYDYLVSMTFVDTQNNSAKTGFKLVGGNYLYLEPRADIRSEMEKITRNNATVFCMPQMFYASKGDKATITLQVIDAQTDKLVPPVVYKKTISIQAIKNPNEAPPWNKPDMAVFEISQLLPGHTYIATATSKLPNRTSVVQKKFTTLK